MTQGVHNIMTKKPYHFLVELINNDNSITVQKATIRDELNRPMNNLLIDDMKGKLYKLYSDRGMDVLNIRFMY